MKERDVLIALDKWLNVISPLVADSLVSILAPDILEQLSNEQGVHGPIAIDLEEFRAPIIGLNFYVVVVEETMMLATTIKTKEIDSLGAIRFDLFFTTTTFPEEIKTEKALKIIKDRVLELFEENNIR